MATYNSNEWANRVAVPSVFNPAYTDGGRMRVQTFSWTSPAGLLQNDILNLVKIPAGSKLISGFVQFGAFGAGATLDIGTLASAQKYAAAIAVNAAGTSSAILSTAALNYGLVLTADEYIVAKLSGAAWAAAQPLNGHIVYVKD